MKTIETLILPFIMLSVSFYITVHLLVAMYHRGVNGVYLGAVFLFIGLGVMTIREYRRSGR